MTSSSLEEQRDLHKGTSIDDAVTKVESDSTPKEAVETDRWRDGILLVPQPTDDPKDPLVRIDLSIYILLCQISLTGS